MDQGKYNGRNIGMVDRDRTHNAKRAGRNQEGVSIYPAELGIGIRLDGSYLVMTVEDLKSMAGCRSGSAKDRGLGLHVYAELGVEPIRFSHHLINRKYEIGWAFLMDIIS